MIEALFRDWHQYFCAQWEQGEHIAVCGQTGVGKTTVMCFALDARLFVAAITLKPEDETLDLYKQRGYNFVDHVRDIPHKRPLPIPYRVVITIEQHSLIDTKQQALETLHTLDKLYQEKNWCIYLDDANTLVNLPETKHVVVPLLNTGRSSGLSIVCAMTQPKSIFRIPSEISKQCKHLMLFRTMHTDEIKAYADIAGLHWKEMQAIQQRLYSHDFLYRGKSGEMALVRVPHWTF